MPRALMVATMIATKIRGIRDMIDESCGLLFPMQDVAALARALNWVIDHPQEAVAMGQRGRERMQAEYDIQHIIELHKVLYDRALTGK